ncbi:MAG: hypothetical protein VX624_09410, partial [Pseudomonadota bacterium]|nr:hypothetical protein [Pseudomonadota bacterium]
MSLAIETFSNISGGFSFFKAIGHPLSSRQIKTLISDMNGPVAIYDPLGFASPFAEIYSCTGLELAGVYVQEIDRICTDIIGCKAQPATDLLNSEARTIFIAAFDAERLAEH